LPFERERVVERLMAAVCAAARARVFVRLSVQGYTTPAEIERLLDAPTLAV